MAERSALMQGTVVASHGRHCVVETPDGQRRICHPRGKKSQAVVGDHVLSALERGAHAYLCGPPVMVDAVSAVLRDRGIAKEQIRADRFTTLHDSTGAQ